MSNENPKTDGVKNVKTAPKIPPMKRTKTVDPNETSEAKFIRLGQARMTKCLKTITQIARLGKASQYNHEKRNLRMVAIKKALIEAVNVAIPDITGVKENGFKIE